MGNCLVSLPLMSCNPTGMYQYFLKVVPTVYTDINGHVIHSNQFSVTEHFKGDAACRIQSFPGVFFFYDLSPIKVTFTELHVPFLHFLTNVFAIVGGKIVWSSSGISQFPVYSMLSYVTAKEQSRRKWI